MRWVLRVVCILLRYEALKLYLLMNPIFKVTKLVKYANWPPDCYLLEFTTMIASILSIARIERHKLRLNGRSLKLGKLSRKKNNSL